MDIDTVGVLKNISNDGKSATFECPMGYAINNRPSVNIICHAGSWRYVHRPLLNLTCEQATVIFKNKTKPNEGERFWKQIHDCISNGSCKNRDDALERWFPTNGNEKEPNAKKSEIIISSKTAGFVAMIIGLLTAAQALLEIVMYIRKIRAARAAREAAGHSDDDVSVDDDDQCEYYYEEHEIDEFYLPLASES